MDIFRYRGVALGCGAFLVSLYCSYYFNSIAKVLIMIAAPLLLFVLVISYLIFKKKSILNGVIKYAPIFILIAAAMLVSLLSFSKGNHATRYLDSEQHEIVATVKEEYYESEFESVYIVKIEQIDGEKENVSAVFKLSGDGLERNAKIKADAVFSPLDSITVGYDYKRSYLEKGITFVAESEACDILEKGERNLSFVSALNHKLSERFFDNMSHKSASLYSALLLGNSKELGDDIRRDCARVGMSHALSLSGMHITIIALLIGFIIRFVPFLKRISKNLIIILCIVFFVALTGFSESALRAGLMMIFYYLIKTVGYKIDSITALFLAMTAICTVMPYSVFSVSLLLSFFAMLGCLVSVRFFYKSRLRRIKLKPFRYIVFSITTTLFVIGFTLPVVFNAFGSFSLLTPISNLLLVPAFTVLIYFAPFMLLFSDVRYLSDALFFVGEKLSEWLLLIINKFASLENVVLHTYSVLQIIGTVMIFASLIALMIVKRKHFKKAIIGVFVAVLIFSLGSVVNFIDRQASTYITTYNYKTSDFVAVEKDNSLTVIDVSTTTQGIKDKAVGLVGYLHYSDVENYIICDYSHVTNKYFEMVAKNVKIRNLYLPSPDNSDEISMYKKLESVSKSEKINVHTISDKNDFGNFQIEFAENDYIDRSERRSVSFNVNVNGYSFLYLGSAGYEIFDYFTREKAYYADAAVFGSYGPSYQIKYGYEMPYVERLVFYGTAADMADDDFLLANKEFIVNNTDAPIKFKLKGKKE